MQGHTFLHTQVCRTVSIMAWGHHNFILNGYLYVSLSDDRTGLFLYFSSMLVSPAPSPSWCHGVNGQDDSRFTRDYYPKMKGEEYTCPDTNPALYCVHRGQWWRGLCSMWSPRDPGIRGSTILWLYHLEHTAHFDITAREKGAWISHTCACVLQPESRVYQILASSQI